MGVERAIGIDLAGIGGNNTSAVEVIREGNQLHATISEQQLLGHNIPGTDLAAVALGQDAEVLGGWLAEAPERPVVFDCPIDLQELGGVIDVEYIWQLRLRAIDHMLNGLGPLSSLLGAVVARCRSTLAYGNLSRQLGRSIYETYPKAILARLGLEAVKGWSATLSQDSTIDVQPQEDTESVTELLDQLRITTNERSILLSDHDLDAILCTIPLLSDVGIGEDELSEELQLQYPDQHFRAPRGFVLVPDGMNVWWDTILIKRSWGQPDAATPTLDMATMADDTAHPVAGGRNTCDDAECLLHGEELDLKQCPYCAMAGGEWRKPDQTTWGGIDGHVLNCTHAPQDLTYDDFRTGICHQHWPE